MALLASGDHSVEVAETLEMGSGSDAFQHQWLLLFHHSGSGVVQELWATNEGKDLVPRGIVLPTCIQKLALLTGPLHLYSH